jgi:thermitase
MSIFRIGQVDHDLQVVGAGVRFGTLPPAEVAVDWHLGSREMRDLEAFQASGWRFHPQPELDWSAVKAHNGPEVEAGLLARHPWGGLVIIRDRVVLNTPEPLDPGLFGEQIERLREVTPSLYLFHLPLPDSNLLGTIHTSLTFFLALDGGAGNLTAEPMLVYNLGTPGTVASIDLDEQIQWQWDKIELAAAWNIGTTLGKRLDTGDPIRVAIIDYGFHVNELEIKGNILWTRYVDDLGNVTDPAIQKDPHGTFCAGLVGALHNITGVNGAAPECKLILIVVQSISTQTAISTAIRLCAAGVNGTGSDGADVICSSLGPPKQSWDRAADLKSAIDDVQRTGRQMLGTPIVWADFDVEDPIKADSLEDYGPILCVAQSSRGDDHVNSGYGPGVDLLAPGVGVLGLTPDSAASYGYGYGCSYAAPCVAGVAALVLAIKPGLHWSEVSDVLTQSCNPPKLSNGRNDYEGSGRLNALKAVKAAIAK